jgi:hypothetical protein
MSIPWESDASPPVSYGVSTLRHTQSPYDCGHHCIIYIHHHLPSHPLLQSLSALQRIQEQIARRRNKSRRNPLVARLVYLPLLSLDKSIRMVLTPLARATEMSNVASPLLLPADKSSSASSIHSASPPWTASYPPPLRKNSTGSFSKLSDFRLDPEAEDEEEGNGVEGVRHVVLSVDAQ